MFPYLKCQTVFSLFLLKCFSFINQGCCKEVEVTSSSLAKQYQPARLGTYAKKTTQHGGKVVYGQSGGSNSLYYKTGFGWVFSSQQPGSSSQGGIMSASKTSCPKDATSWKVYDGNTYSRVDSSFKVKCKEASGEHRMRNLKVKRLP